MRIIYRFILLMLVCLSVDGYSQLSTWTDSSYPKAFKVIIPQETSIAMPTSASYTIGYFVYGSGSTVLKNVGKATYVPGTKTEIQLSFDANGNYGYTEGERLISLIRNNSTTEVYGVEFTYDKGKNVFQSGDSTVVTGIKMGTWMDFLKGKSEFCRFTKEWTIEVPFGIQSKLVYSSGFVVDSSGAYPVIKLNAMNLGNYTFQFLYPDMRYSKVMYSFVFRDFPVQYLNATYEICPGDTINISDSYENGALVRGMSQYGSRALTKEGDYYFPIFYYTTSCNTLDTVKVTMKDFPLDEMNKSYFICPGDVVEIPEIDTDAKLSREIIDAPDYKLITPGEYVFKATEIVSGCIQNDTIRVNENNVSCQKLSYASLIDPVHGGGLVLPLEEKIFICNSALEKIVELKTPTIWYGTDSAGNLLPVGVYYIVHENGTTNSVSIIY